MPFSFDGEKVFNTPQSPAVTAPLCFHYREKEGRLTIIVSAESKASTLDERGGGKAKL